MKILCRFSDDESYVPSPFDKNTVDAIMRDVYNAVAEKYHRRYKDLKIDFDNVLYTPDELEVEVNIFNKNVPKKSSVFKFEPHSEYWDKSDYDQHIKRTIVEFVRSI